jgi:2-hydroxychromene-2-carboxylate isomerase
MTVAVEFFFDLSSPWTRIAFHNFRVWAAEQDVAVVWRPFLVGGVFNAVNQSVYAGRQNPDDPKLRLNFVWLKDWAKLAGLPMNFPSPHHPVKSVAAMRFCCALEHDQDALARFAEAAFDAYFAEQRNLDDPAVLTAIADSCGLDGAALGEMAASPSCKDRLRTNTQEAIDRGAFGSPTMFVDRTNMYFGNDQLPLVFQRVAEQAELAAPGTTRAGTTGAGTTGAGKGL